jgi:isocitrate dehydrogenase
MLSTTAKRSFASFKKVKVAKPVVDIDGDEMNKVIWGWIKEKHIHPYVDVKTEYFDLSIQNRDATDDSVTFDCANAVLKHKVGVKCSTITPDKGRVKEFNLKKEWVSPCSTIRNLINGTVFREPIVAGNIPRFVPGWTSPIVVARHGHGDHTSAQDGKTDKPGTFELVFTPADGSAPERFPVHTFTNENKGGCFMG